MFPHRSSLAALLALALCAGTAACHNNKDEAPAPDVAPAAAPAASNPASPGAPVQSAGQRVNREPDYIYLNMITKDGEKSKGKLARMNLKLKGNLDAHPKPGWMTMLATDGSYLSAMLHYSDEFTPIVQEMKPGYVFEVDFQITRVTTGGMPVGEVLAIDRRSAGPVADKTFFLPAVEAVKRAQELPPEAKEARRKQMHEKLEGMVNYVEQKEGDIREAGKPAPAPQAAPAEPAKTK